MPRQPKEKSAHLQELEAVFDRHTRRFSPFAVLGLKSTESNEADSQAHNDAPRGDSESTHSGVGGTHPQDPPTHSGVDPEATSNTLDFTAPAHDPPTPLWVPHPSLGCGSTPE